MWDVIVVGAGPAGSAAAYFLAEAGVRVLLVDRQEFPREKTCGDGVSSDALGLLAAMGLEGWIAREEFVAPRSLLLSAPNGVSAAVDYDSAPFCYGRVIPRDVLDEALVGRAVDAGARFAERLHVRHCARENDRTVRVDGVTGGQLITETAHILIIAEGTSGRLSRELGLISSAPDLVAVRGYFGGAAGPDDLLEIHYARSVTPGYVWVFPLGGGRVNVGLGTFARQVKRRHLNLAAELKQAIQVTPQLHRRLAHSVPESPVRGCPLRTGLQRSRLCADNVLVSGEAAHLVNPLTGEGIASALESGRLAAGRAIAALHEGDFSRKTLAAYADQIKARYAADHRAALLLRQILKYPCVMNQVIRRARNDERLTREIGLAIIGVTSPRVLLKPSMLVRCLF